MERSVPAWLLSITLLLGLVSAVLFGWLVQTTLFNWHNSGPLGRAAVALAHFPTLAREVFDELALRFQPSARYAELRAPLAHPDLADFTPVAAAPGLAIDGLLVRRTGLAPSPGWRILAGVFLIDGAVTHAALLLGPDLTIRRRWLLREPAGLEQPPSPTHRKLVHGLAVLPDASLVFTYSEAVALQRVDRCGRRLWATPGRYHHSVTLEEAAQSVWALRVDPESRPEDDGQPATAAERERIVRVSVEDGRVLQEFSIQDVIDANPEIDILELRRLHDNDSGGNSRGAQGQWMADAFHLNDVDPLPSKLAGRFDSFAAGDLLVSARSLNLVFVIDPETLKVRWWRTGAMQRQHDPDWHESGEISIFNNRMTRGRSEIVAINPATFARRTVYDGRSADFYSRMRGNHQRLPNGNILITSAQQGRVLEVTPAGEVALEFVNADPETSGMAYLVTEAVWLPPEALRMEDFECGQ
jgi:hypothetical protein